MKRTSCYMLAVLLVLVCASSVQAADTRTSKAQMDFGVEMSEIGRWKEALFRFKQAERYELLEPEGPKRQKRLLQILNNTAVAYEALGLFEEALETYQRALKIDKNDTQLRLNYSRFLEFYQQFAEGGTR